MKKQIIYIEGGTRETLSQKEYLASGGEGSIFCKNGRAYKIYTGQRKMISVNKIKELRTISSSSVITPDKIIMDARNNPIGYTMRYVTPTIPLCRIFPRTFRDRNSIDHNQILDLISLMKKGIESCHQKKVLIVDMNDMNFLVKDKVFDEIFFIDTDSYQTPSFAATAITPSIRDLHAKQFSEQTDWFSFGILSFQMLTSVHPYKGKHTKYKTLEERMRHNISILREEVSIAPSAYDPKSVIPKQLLDWYQAIFDDGKRMAPPDKFDGAVIIIAQQAIVVSGAIQLAEERVINGSLVDMKTIRGNTALITTNGFSWNNIDYPDIAAYAKIGIAPKSGKPVSTVVTRKGLTFYDIITKLPIAHNIYANKVFTHGEYIYTVSESSISVVEFQEQQNKILSAYSREIGNIRYQSSFVGDGIVIQDLLKSCYFSIVSGPAHYELYIPELNEHRIIQAKRINEIVVVVSFYNKEYYQSVIVLSKTYDKYTYRVAKMNSLSEISFVLLDKGVCVMINADGKVEVFTKDINDTRIKVVDDDNLVGKQLVTDGISVFIENNNKLYKVNIN